MPPKSIKQTSSVSSPDTGRYTASEEIKSLKKQWASEIDLLRKDLHGKIDLQMSLHKRSDTDLSQTTNTIRDNLRTEIDLKMTEWMDGWSTQLGDLEERISVMEKSLTNIESELDRQQQYGRRICLVVHGLPEEKDEHSIVKAIDLFNDKLGSTLISTDVDGAHRIGRFHGNTAGNQSSRPMIVRFMRMAQRDFIFNNKRLLKGTGIVISESLTPTRKRLFDEIRQSGRQCWTRSGNIVILTEKGQRIILRSLMDMRSYLVAQK